MFLKAMNKTTKKKSMYWPKFPKFKDRSESGRVRCIELDKVYESVDEAIRAMDGEYKEAITRACMFSHMMAFGYHWEWVD